MSAKTNVPIVKEFFDAIGSGDKRRLLALVTEDIEWIIPGKDGETVADAAVQYLNCGRDNPKN